MELDLQHEEKPHEGDQFCVGLQTISEVVASKEGRLELFVLGVSRCSWDDMSSTVLDSTGLSS